MAELLAPAFRPLVSKKRNARYTGSDMFNMTLGVAVSNKFVGQVYKHIRNDDTEVEIDAPFWKSLPCMVQDASKNKKIPTSHWFFNRLKQYPKEYLLEQGIQTIDATVRRCKAMGMLKKPVTIAIDGHKRPCHSKDEDLLVGGKPKGGTSKMETYITAQIVDDVRLTLAVLPRTDDDDRADLIKELIKKIRELKIKIKKIMLDRGYYSVSVLKALRELHISYIMMIKKYEPIQKLIIAYHNGTGKQTVPYEVTSTDGSEKIRLLIVKRKDADKQEEIIDKYIVLAYHGCRRKVADIIAYVPEEYRKRWGIETGYRNIGFIRAKTRSMIPGVRWFLFLFSAAVANFWVLANYVSAGAKDGIITPTITIEFFKIHMLQHIIRILYNKDVQMPDIPH